MPRDNKYGQVTLENQRNIADDEPVVVFRAQDRFLPDVLRYYSNLCEIGGSPQNHINLIRKTLRDIHEWQQNHITKTPESKGFQV